MPRRYGQHFLKDPKTVERIAEASGIGSDDGVFEIGPGRGILTKALAARARKVLALEIDRALHTGLLEAGLPPNVELRLGDALTFSETEIIEALGPHYHVVANLPYDITSAFLQRYLTLPRPPRTMTLMVQKEVGERIVAKDGRQSRLSLFCGYHSEPKILFKVGRGHFSPPPEVDSVVISLNIAKIEAGEHRGLDPDVEQRLFRLIEAGFSQKRKNLKNTLRQILGEDVENKLKRVGIDPSKRPEEISLFEWMTLASSV